MEATQLVNKLGKYLYKTIDSAYNIKFSPNMCDVDFTVMYQIHEQVDTLRESTLNINITSYKDKVRVNVTWYADDEEYTILHQTFLTSLTLEQMKSKLMNNIESKLAKAFQDYDFIY